jgi:CRP/FNR family transcriptional regulator
MTRKDIADYLGLTIETVSRTMSTMRRNGLISFDDAASVQLRRCDTLERMAQAA